MAKITNVPEEIRSIWTEMYKLFDKHYLMENNEESWQKFWDEAVAIYYHSGEKPYVKDGLVAISDAIGERMTKFRVDE